MPRAPVFTPGYLVSSAKGSGAQFALRTSSQSPKRCGSGAVGFSKHGSLTRAEPMPARVAIALLAVAVILARMRGHDLEEIESRQGVLRHLVPEAIVAAGPDEPHVAASDFAPASVGRRCPCRGRSLRSPAEGLPRSFPRVALHRSALGLIRRSGRRRAARAPRRKGYSRRTTPTFACRASSAGKRCR